MSPLFVFSAGRLGRVLSPAKPSAASRVMGIGSGDLTWDKGPRGGEPRVAEDGCPGKGAGLWKV